MNFKMSKQTGENSEELRRFRYITDDRSKLDRVNALIEAKSLSREDVALILTTLAINFDIFLQST